MEVDFMRKYVKLSWIGTIAAFVTAVFSVIFFAWAFSMKEQNAAAFMLPLLFFALFCVAALKLVPALEEFWKTEKSFIDFDSKPVVMTLAAVWIGLVALALMVVAVQRNPGYSLSGALRVLTNRIDSNHYYDIAKNWYQNNETDQQFFIVFFPLYPLLLKLCPFPDFYPVFSVILGAALTFAACFMFYDLAGMLSHNARKSLKYLLFFPASFFFLLPMTESLFLLISVAFFYFVLKKNYIVVFVLGFLAALCRLQGVLLIVPLFLELVRASREGEAKKSHFLTLVSPFIGVAVYLIINKLVYGNFFEFLKVQSEHWHQNFTFFFDTVRILLNQSLTSTGMTEPFGVFIGIPEVAVMLFVLGLIVAAGRRLRPSMFAYCLTYFFVSFGATWLLSAIRYSAVLFPLAFCSAEIGKEKKLDRLLTVVYTVSFFVYFTVFLNGSPVY